MKTTAEIRKAHLLLDSLLDGDSFDRIISSTPDQELAVLVMRDVMAWVLGLSPGSENIEKNLMSLRGLKSQIQ